MVTSPPQPHHFHEPEGHFAVDHRSHDGKIVLGQGDWSVETEWSVAGTGLIHTYNDPVSIRAIAVASGAGEIEDVTPAVWASSDFSSRSRTPQEGQVVLIENDRGIAFAVKVDRVTNSAEGQAGTVFEARYRVLVDGTRDFSLGDPPPVAEIRSIAAEALAASETLEGFEALSSSDYGMGHNGPPPDQALTSQELVGLREALKELATLKSADDRVADRGEVVRNFGKKITDWLARRAQLIDEGFFRGIGTTGATGFVLTAMAGWAYLAGHLQDLVNAIQHVM